MALDHFRDEEASPLSLSIHFLYGGISETLVMQPIEYLLNAYL